MKNEKNTPYLGGLYLRLSEKDRDAGDAPSESIQNQRMLLENAAKAKGILPCTLTTAIPGRALIVPHSAA